MPARSSSVYAFGDLLALARQSWIGELTRRLEAVGYGGYRRSDSAAMRLLLVRGPVPVGQLGASLGVTRQAARKVAEALQRRGYVTTRRGPVDSREVHVDLTETGRDYAYAIVAAIRELNREVRERVDPVQLAAADTVLRAALFDEGTRERASRLPAPG
jgi:DNA-binding MarR family transcriptional regulator